MRWRKRRGIYRGGAGGVKKNWKREGGMDE